MRNVKMTVKGKTLTIVVDLAAKRVDSKSGKTELIASTEGNVSVPDHDDIKIGVNCYASK